MNRESFTNPDRVVITFDNTSLTIFRDGHGKTSVAAECCSGNLEFPPHGESVEELRGAPFQPTNSTLGYLINPLFGYSESGTLTRARQQFANAEHEALHLWVCENVLKCRCVKHDGEQTATHTNGVMMEMARVYERVETIVTTIQILSNNREFYHELHSLQRLAFEYALLQCGFETENERANILAEALRFAYELRYYIANEFGL